MSELPFGIDLSRYQYSSDGKQKPDFDKIDSTCDFVAVRAGISWGYTDPWFSYSWNHIEKPRLAYHVVHPGEWSSKQMAHFLDIVKPREHDRLVLDMELDHGYSKARITGTLLDCLDFILANTGRYPIIYSRASWINQFVDVSALPTNVDWWLAGYLKPLPSPFYTKEATPPPALPKGVTKWLIHQTAERGNGGAVGVVSHYVDTDRWNGTKEQLLAYFGLGEEVPAPPIEPPEEPVKLFDARVYSWATPYVNLRSEPRVAKETDIGDIYPNTVIPVYEVLGDWYRTSYKGVNGFVMSEFLERLDFEPPAVVDFAYYGGIYNQRDVRWAAHPLGTKSTIGANGCLMTCASMVCNHFGHASNPLQLNDWLIANNGYLNGNLFIWDAIERLYPDMKFDGFISNPSTSQIRAAILAGTLPIMYVDFNDDTPIIEMHWVLGIGVTNDDVMIADPWTGTIGKLSEMYPKNVIRYGSYKRR